MTEEIPLSESVIEALREGRKIEAIKRLRTERGLGLKDSKMIIEREIALNHSLNPHYTVKPKQIPLSAIIFLVGLITVAVCYYLANQSNDNDNLIPESSQTRLLHP